MNASPTATATAARLRRTLLGRRRLAAALLLGVATFAGLRVVSPPPAATDLLVVAERDLPAGTTLTAEDLAEIDVPPDLVPAGALGLRDSIGRTLTGPARRGEPLTDVRVVQESLLAGYPGRVAAPVRIGDAAAVRLLRAGDRVDLLAASPEDLEADVVVRDAAVVAVPRIEESGFSATDISQGGLLIVAITEESAARLAQAGVSSFISLVIRR